MASGQEQERGVTVRERERLRAISLPDGVSADAIEATYQDGVLEVAIPRPTTPEAKRIKVRVK